MTPRTAVNCSKACLQQQASKRMGNITGKNSSLTNKLNASVLTLIWRSMELHLPIKPQVYLYPQLLLQMSDWSSWNSTYRKQRALMESQATYSGSAEQLAGVYEHLTSLHAISSQVLDAKLANLKLKVTTHDLLKLALSRLALKWKRK